MDARKFDLNLLKVVQAISQHGTVSKAAEKLNVTQPAVSNALARLRELTGDPVFIRGNRGQTPTEFGKSLIELSRSILLQVKSCVEKPTEFDPARHSRTFRIMLDDFLEASFVPYLLKEISPYSHNINFRLLPIKSLALADVMEEDRIDSIISARVETYSGSTRLRFDELLSDALCVAVSRSNQIARKSSLSKKDFLGLRYVIVRPDSTHYQTPEIILRNTGIRRKIAMEVSNARSLPSMAAASDYAITVSKILFRDLIELYDLKTFDIPFEFPPIRIMAGYHVKDEKSPAVTWLRTKLHETSRTTVFAPKSSGHIQPGFL